MTHVNDVILLMDHEQHQSGEHDVHATNDPRFTFIIIPALRLNDLINDQSIKLLMKYIDQQNQLSVQTIA